MHIQSLHSYENDVLNVLMFCHIIKAALTRPPHDSLQKCANFIQTNKHDKKRRQQFNNQLNNFTQ